jgi:hypothetical protein
MKPSPPLRCGGVAGMYATSKDVRGQETSPTPIRLNAAVNWRVKCQYREMGLPNPARGGEIKGD